MKEKQTLGELLDNKISEINKDIDLLSSNTIKSKWDILNRLKEEIAVLSNLISIINSDYILEVKVTPKKSKPVMVQKEVQVSDDLRTFTEEELAEYTGKDGKPAYCAVNGIVYDVTNNVTWMSGTHFGLPSGKNLTIEYIQCHEGDDILNKLKVVGKMA